jgi:Flp pilus assembly pilin Flp
VEQLFRILDAIAHRVNRMEGDDRGATATEYAILVAFIALLIILGVAFFGGALNDWFHNLGSHVNTFNT